MKGQAPSYWITPETLVRGLFEDGSDELILLNLAACNAIELHADKKLWNSILWLLVNNLKRDGKPIITGKELGELRARLPVVFH
ncbi:MAG: hypothetical protein QGI36_00790 [Candidatus Thalassarchaeaceae archaeon]|jgi:hypothetical protein|nr:hypothetical protein [Candidatus Thalassarchaeaceae archaeon]